MERSQLCQLLHHARQEGSTLITKSRKVKGKTFKVFVAQDLVEWLSNQEGVNSKDHSQEILQLMSTEGLIVSLDGATDVADLNVSFRFKEPEDTGEGGTESEAEDLSSPKDRKKNLSRSTSSGKKVKKINESGKAKEERSIPEEDEITVKKPKSPKSKIGDSGTSLSVTRSSDKKAFGRTPSGKDLIHYKVGSDGEYNSPLKIPRGDLLSGHRKVLDSSKNSEETEPRIPNTSSPSSFGKSDTTLQTPTSRPNLSALSSIPSVPEDDILAPRDGPPPPNYIPAPPTEEQIGISKKSGKKRRDKETKRRKSQKGNTNKLLKSTLLLAGDDEVENLSFTESTTGSIDSSKAKIPKRAIKKKKKNLESSEYDDSEAFDVSALKDEDHSIVPEDSEIDPTTGSLYESQNISLHHHREFRRTPTLKLASDGGDGEDDYDLEVLKPSTPSPRSLSADVSLLRWSFLDSDKHSSMICLKEGTLLSWDVKDQWGFARCIFPLGNYSFFEVSKVGGTSQCLQVGISCSDVDCSSSIKQTQFGRARFPGTWLLCKIQPPIRVGDKIGILVNQSARWVYIYKNYEPMKHLKFQQFFSRATPTGATLFPTIGMSGEMQLEITHKPSFEKYTELRFTPEHTFQTEYKSAKISGTTPVVIGTISELLDSLNIVSHRPILLEQINLEILTREFLRTLHLPTPLEQKIWTFRNLLLTNSEEKTNVSAPALAFLQAEIEIADA